MLEFIKSFDMQLRKTYIQILSCALLLHFTTCMIPIPKFILVLLSPLL
jgi:hypothetical protein